MTGNEDLTEYSTGEQPTNSPVDEAERLAMRLQTNGHTTADAMHDVVERLRASCDDADETQDLIWELDRIADALARHGHTLHSDVQALATRVARVHAVPYYPEWAWGDPCPNCGNTRFARTETTTDEVWPTENDGMEVGECWNAERESLTCAECWTLLPPHKHPE